MNLKDKYSFLFMLLIFDIFTVFATPAINTQSVLVIHSYHPGFYWTNLVMEGIDEGFQTTDLSFHLFIEYMDFKRYPNFPQDQITAGLKWKLKEFTPSVILVSDNGALEYSMEKREELFPGVPIVFCGINGDIKTIIGEEKGITGIAERWDPQNTLELITQLQPEVRKVYVLHDYTESGLGTLEDFELVKDNFSRTFDFEILPDVPIERAIEQIENGPTDSVLLLLGYNIDKNGRVFNSDDIAKYLLEKISKPIYTMDRTRFVPGVVGGSLLSGKGQGEVAAEMAIKILSGSSVENIPIIIDPQPNLVVDYPALTQFNIPLSRVPRNAHIINQPVTFYSRYKYLIWGTGFVIVLLSTLSIVLLLNLVMKHRLESERSRLIAILEATTDIISIHSLEGETLYMNTSGIKLIGPLQQEGSIDNAFSGLPLLNETFIKENFKKKRIWNGESDLVTAKGTIPVSQLVILYETSSEKEQYIFSILRDISRQKENEDQIRRNEENLRITLDSIGDAVITTDSRGIIVDMNRAGEKLTGWLIEKALGRNLQEVLVLRSEVTAEPVENPVEQVLQTRSEYHLTDKDLMLIDQEGIKKNITESAAPIINNEGTVLGVVLVFHDVTEKMKQEEQLRQTQRLEQIGQLAGGVAHDFNNLLTIILGTAQLLEETLPEESEEKQYAKDIMTASLQAGELTSHLLTFSRKGKMSKATLHFHVIILEVIKLLSRSLDKRIRIESNNEAARDFIEGDPVALQSAILNLAINSRDAIEGKGYIKFSTKVITINPEDQNHRNLTPGEYLLLKVEDSGKGMTADVQKRIFEPYYTTKPAGKGTGLGLAAVYGCIQTHKGSIHVNSSQGKGTTFYIYLPLVEE